MMPKKLRLTYSAMPGVTTRTQASCSRQRVCRAAAIFASGYSRERPPVGEEQPRQGCRGLAGIYCRNSRRNCFRFSRRRAARSRRRRQLVFHSAIAPYALRKLSQKYEAYLKRQEALIRDGKLTEAERDRIKFQRDAAKYVGAPLLGAFSVAAGAGLVFEAFTGGAVTGIPINIVLGGNPMLSSIWLFSNGLVCFYNGYKFFMMALGDQEDVARVVRDIKGLLPAEVA